MPPTRSPFLAFEEYHIPEPNSGCWLWIGTVNDKGYGQMHCGGYDGYAHRFSYRYFVLGGADLGGLHVCHRCDNPSCVNPDHLFLGTHRQNMEDSIKKGRHVSVNPNVNFARGSRSARAKLTEKSVQEIWRLKFHRSQKEIATLYGVTPRAIRRIFSGETWGHVPPSLARLCGNED